MQTISETRPRPRKVRRIKAQYPGVRFCNKTKTWRAKIKINGVNFILGYYELEADAAKVYQDAKEQVRSLQSVKT